MSEPVALGQLTVVPAIEASRGDLVAIFGTTGYPGLCQCQRFKGARLLPARHRAVGARADAPRPERM